MWQKTFDPDDKKGLRYDFIKISREIPLLSPAKIPFLYGIGRLVLQNSITPYNIPRNQSPTFPRSPTFFLTPLSNASTKDRLSVFSIL